MKKPNFFIIGAPKCGTTSMHSWLSTHPHIFLSTPKEPHFFCDDEYPRRIRNWKDYEHLFVQATEQHLAVGEASVSYLYEQHAVQKICQYQPDAKFIVMLRNPIDLVLSTHSQTVINANEPIRDFKQAWYAQEKRQQNRYRVPWFTDVRTLLYGPRCKTGEQVERLLSQVKKVQVHFVLLEDIVANPKAEYQKVLEFLGVADDGRTDFPVLNSAQVPKSKLIGKFLYALRSLKRKIWIPKLNWGINSKLTQINRIQKNRQPIDLEMKKELIQYFQTDVQKLSQILGRDLSHWLQ